MAPIRVWHRALAAGVVVLSIVLAGTPADAAWRGGGGGWHGGVWRGGAWGGGWRGGGWRGGAWGGGWRGGGWRGGAWGGPGWGYRPWGVWGNPWIGFAGVPIYLSPYPAYDVYEDEPGVCALRRLWVRGPYGWHRVRHRVCW